VLKSLQPFGLQPTVSLFYAKLMRFSQSKDWYQVAGQLSGTGFAPAGMYDLIRPHK